MLLRRRTMAARRTMKNETVKDGSERIFDLVSKAYWLWAVGVIIGALGLKAGSLSAAGFGLTVERPEIVQGVVYLAALFHVAQVYMNIFQNTSNPYVRRDPLREFIWQSLPRGTRSFRHMSKADLDTLREKVRKAVKGISAIPVVFATVPAFFIIVSS